MSPPYQFQPEDQAGPFLIFLLVFGIWLWCLSRSEKIEHGGFKARRDEYKRARRARTQELVRKQREEVKTNGPSK